MIIGVVSSIAEAAGYDAHEPHQFACPRRDRESGDVALLSG